MDNPGIQIWVEFLHPNARIDSRRLPSVSCVIAMVDMAEARDEHLALMVR
jgi:hypothetical protein